MNLGTRVVKTLTDPLKVKFHHAYFNNFFTNKQLMPELENGVYVCGTVRKDHRGFPDQLMRVNLKNRYTKIIKVLNITIMY